MILTLLSGFLTSRAEADVVLPESVCDSVVVESPAEKPQLEEFEQKLPHSAFVPKGVWVAGLSVSYDMSNQNNYQFLVLENISGDTYTFKLSPMVCYLVKEDMGLGGRFAYQRSLTKLENADIVLDSETDYNVDHLYQLSHNYYATAMMRNYFPIGNSKRVGLFNEAQVQLGGGQSKLMTGTGESISGNYETNFSFNIGFSPGVVFFLTDYSAIEVNVGVLGFQYVRTKTLTDRIYESSRKSQSANFRINLFSISFGVAFYI